MKTTEEILISMLKENTGSHVLDSGGAYGRHWEKNKGKDFENEPTVFLKFSEHGIKATHNLYHWLAKRLEYNEELTNNFHEFADSQENEDKNWMENIEEFTEEIGATNVGTINTYNGEDALSQTIQYTRFELNGNDHIILRIHGGCDIRGGYSTPIIFNEYEFGALFDNARLSMYCERSDVDPNQLELEGFERDNSPHYWDSYNAGYEWEPENGSSLNLEDYEISMDETDKGQGKLYVDEDGDGYCPVCGSRLHAS